MVPAVHQTPSEPVEVVSSIDDLVSFAAAHPRQLVVLREASPPPPDGLRRHARRLGSVVEARGFGELRAIRYEPAVTDSIALSLDALPPHTDGSFLERPPSRFLMSCVRGDQGGGGVSTFYPVDPLMADMPGWVVDALRRADYWFPQSYDGRSGGSAWVGPVLDEDPARRSRIRWRSDALFQPPVVRASGTRADDAVRWLHEHLAVRPPLWWAARPGETLLVPNQVMLHGRTALTPGSRRELLRIWVA
jgi:hypothetical protein